MLAAGFPVTAAAAAAAEEEGGTEWSWGMRRFVSLREGWGSRKMWSRSRRGPLWRSMGARTGGVEVTRPCLRSFLGVEGRSIYRIQLALLPFIFYTSRSRHVFISCISSLPSSRISNSSLLPITPMCVSPLPSPSTQRLLALMASSCLSAAQIPCS